MAIFCQMKTLDPRVDTRLDRLLASAMSKVGKACVVRKVTAWCHWQLDPAAAAEAGAHSAAVEAVAAGLVMSDVE